MSQEQFESLLHRVRADKAAGESKAADGAGGDDGDACTDAGDGEAKEEGGAEWQFLDDEDIWRPFPADLQEVAEKAFQAGEGTAEYTTAGVLKRQNVRLDFRGEVMSQRNLATDKVRRG